MESNRFKLNTDKTHFMIMSTYQSKMVLSGKEALKQIKAKVNWLGNKEQTEPKILAEIRPKAEIRLRLGRNQTPIHKFRFWLGRNRNLMTNFGLNQKFGRN